VRLVPIAAGKNPLSRAPCPAIPKRLRPCPLPRKQVVTRHMRMMATIQFQYNPSGLLRFVEGASREVNPTCLDRHASGGRRPTIRISRFGPDGAARLFRPPTMLNHRRLVANGIELGLIDRRENFVRLFVCRGRPRSLDYAGACRRTSKLRTEDGCHMPPRGARMPRLFNSLASPESDCPCVVQTSAMISAYSEARDAAFWRTASRAAEVPLPARRIASAPLGLPSLIPRAFAAASAAIVRSDVSLRSRCATAARI
jgi:hypothetical protein